MNELLDLAVQIAKKAGALLLERPDQLSIDTKTSKLDIVTHMDKASEKLIVEAILAARPDDGIIGEEGADRPSKSGYTWVIDPIDGTVNYFYNLHGWSVSIAIRDNQGVAVGVRIASPVPAEVQSATVGRGQNAITVGEWMHRSRFLYLGDSHDRPAPVAVPRRLHHDVDARVHLLTEQGAG